MRRFTVLALLGFVTACGAEPACPDGACVSLDASLDGAADDVSDAGDATEPEDAGPSEVCTSSTAGLPPADEDLDGAVDEGCPWHVGVPHGLVFADTHLSINTTTIRMTNGGRSIWYAGYHGDPSLGVATRVVRRPSVTEPFGTRRHTAVESTQILSVSEDELTAVGVASGKTWRYSRDTTATPFGNPVELLATEVTDPFLTESGLELWYSSAGVVHRAHRTSLASPFGTPDPIALGGGGCYAPILSDDGLTLFFQKGSRFDLAYDIFTARRSSRETNTFSTPQKLLVPATSMFPRSGAPYYLEATRELFFVSGGAYGSNFLYRAEICRDGPCPVRAVDCPSPAVRSADGVRCFTLVTTPATFDQAVAACAQTSPLGYLASTHTPYTDRELVWGTFAASAPFFVGYHDRDTEGSFASISGESSTSLGVVTGDGPANSEDCAALDPDATSPHGGATGGHPDDVDCALPLPYVCETELWPLW